MLIEFVFAFMICSSHMEENDHCEDGIVVARSCEIAEKWVIDGLRVTQSIVYSFCKEKE